MIKKKKMYWYDNNVAFVGVWDYYYGKRQLFARHGVHATGWSLGAGWFD